MRRPNIMTTIVRRFQKSEEGTAAVELMLTIPMLVWAFVATVTYFDAYQAEANSNRTASTIADMYSRETEYITPAYLNGTRDMLDFLSFAPRTPDFRVTVFEWQDSENRYRVRWSRERGSQPTLSTADLAGLANKLPLLAGGQKAILFETWTDYSPNFEVGLSDFQFETFTVVMPRFTEQVCWNSDADLDPAEARC